MPRDILAPDEWALERYTDHMYGHITGGMAVRPEDREGITWRELQHGLRTLFAEMRKADVLHEAEDKSL